MKSYVRSSGVANHQPEVLDFMFAISGAKAVTPVAPAPEAIVMFDTGTTQTTIDSFLGVANDVLATAFGSSRLGTDMVGFILNLEGGVRQLISVEASIVLAGKGTNVKLVSIPTGTALTDADAGSITFEKSAAGNVYGSITLSNLDSATAGMIHLRVVCRLK
jgi:hypothetical protein